MTSILTKIDFLVDPATTSTVQETVDKTLAKLEEIQIAATNKDASGVFIKYYYGFVYDSRTDVKHYIFPTDTELHYGLTKKVFRDYEVIPSTDITTLNNQGATGTTGSTGASANSNVWNDHALVSTPVWSNATAYEALRPFTIGQTVSLTVAAAGIVSNTIASYDWTVLDPTTGVTLLSNGLATTSFVVGNIQTATIEVIAIDNAGNKSRPLIFTIDIMKNMKPYFSPLAITFGPTPFTDNYTKKVKEILISGGMDKDGTVSTYTVSAVTGFTGTFKSMTDVTLTVPFTINKDEKFKVYSDTPTSGTLSIIATDNGGAKSTATSVSIALVEPTLTYTIAPTKIASYDPTDITLSRSSLTNYTPAQFKVYSISGITASFTTMAGVALTLPFTVAAGDKFKMTPSSAGTGILTVSSIDNEGDEYSTKTVTIIAQDANQLFAVGTNSTGQLGDGTTVNRTTIGLVNTEHDWKQFTVGSGSSYAIKNDGTLWAWGSNLLGQLGDGTSIDKLIPTKIGTATNWKQVQAGADFVAAIKTDGTLWTSGNNTYGQLGDGTNTARSTLTQVGSINTWATLSIMGSDCLTTHAIQADGTLWGFGYNGNSHLGDGTNIHKNIPTKIGTATDWKQISASSAFASGVKTNGTLWTWGMFTQGNYITKSATPIQVGALTTWKEVMHGDRNTYALQTNGVLYSWGWNLYGQCGDGTTTDKTSPVSVLTNVAKVSGGYVCCAATKLDGTLWAWGSNISGTYGATNYSSNTPIQIGTATIWSDVKTSRSNHSILISGII